MFSPCNSPNLQNDLCPTSRDGLLGVRTLSSAEGLGMIIKTALGLELHMSSLAAMLIYVSSRVPVYLVDLSMSLWKSRKRSYRYRVKCEECEKEFDSDYVEAHSRVVHSGRKVRCLPVVESSQLKLSDFRSLDRLLVISSLKAVQQSHLQVRHRRHRLLDIVQRVKNVQFHQQTKLLKCKILNQSTKIHLHLMPQ